MRPPGAPWEGAGDLEGGPDASTPRWSAQTPGFGGMADPGASPLPPGSEWAYGTPMSALSAGSYEASAQKVRVDLRSLDSEALREVRESTLELHTGGAGAQLAEDDYTFRMTPVMARAMASVNARARAREAASPAPSAAARTPALAGGPGTPDQALPPSTVTPPPPSKSKVSLDVRSLDSEALRGIRETAIGLQSAGGRPGTALDEDDYQIRVSPVMARAMANVNARAKAREAGSPAGAQATPHTAGPSEAGRSPQAYAVTPNPLYEERERSRELSPRRSTESEAPSHRRTLSVDLDRIAWAPEAQQAQACGEPLVSPAGSLVVTGEAETPGDAAAGKAWRQPGYAFPELNRGSRGFSFRPASTAGPRLSPRHMEGGAEAGRPASSPAGSSQASSPDRTEYGEGVASPNTAIRAQLAQTPWLGSVQHFISSPSTGGSQQQQQPPAPATRSRLSPRGAPPARAPAASLQHTPMQAVATGGFGSPLTAGDSPAQFASPPVQRSDTASSWTIAAGHPEPVLAAPSPQQQQPAQWSPASPARPPSPTREKTRLLLTTKPAPRKASAGRRLLVSAGLLLLLAGGPALLYSTHEPLQAWVASKWAAQPPQQSELQPPPPLLQQRPAPPAGPQWWLSAKAAAADALQCRARDPAWLCSTKAWLLRFGRLTERWVHLAGSHTAAWDSDKQLPEFAELMSGSGPELTSPPLLPPPEPATLEEVAEEPREPELPAPEPAAELPQPSAAPEAQPQPEAPAEQEAAQDTEPQAEPAAVPSGEESTDVPEQLSPEPLAPAPAAAARPEEAASEAAAAAPEPARGWAVPLALAASGAAVLAALAWMAFSRPAAAAAAEEECLAPEPSYEPAAAREASPEPSTHARSGSPEPSPAATGLRSISRRLTRSVSRALSREPSAAAEPGATWLPSKQAPGRLRKVESPPGSLAFRQMRGRTVVTDADGLQVGDLAPGAHQAEQQTAMQTPHTKPARRGRAPAATEPARAKPPASAVRATRGKKLEPLAEAQLPEAEAAAAPATRRSTRARARA